MRKKMKNILLIEDNYEISLIFRYFIINQPDMVLIDVVPSAEEANKKMAVQNPDVVIIDINQITCDGISLIERISSMENTQKPKFIVISSVENDNMNRRAAELGANCFVFPFKFRDLFDCIRGV